jgi:membrane-associated phospholipid phosphatase
VKPAGGFSVREAGAWAWAPPIVALVLLAAVHFSGSNTALFLFLNHLSGYTGDTFWAGATVFGDTLVVLALLLPLWHRRPDVVAAALLAALLAAAWTHGLKPLGGSPRPPAVLAQDVLHVIGPAYRMGSFPSGHTTAIFTLVGVLALTVGNRLRWPLLAFAVLVALSRSVVGVHWPVDLLGGMLGGWLSALGGLWLARRWRWSTGRVGRTLSLGIPMLAAVGLVVGHDMGFPQVDWLVRGVGAACLLAWAMEGGVRLLRKPGA